MGFKKFTAVAVAVDMEVFTAPCGDYRQVIEEFGSECDVFLVKSDLSYKKMSISGPSTASTDGVYLCRFRECKFEAVKCY